MDAARLLAAAVRGDLQPAARGINGVKRRQRGRRKINPADIRDGVQKRIQLIIVNKQRLLQSGAGLEHNGNAVRFLAVAGVP